MTIQILPVPADDDSGEGSGRPALADLDLTRTLGQAGRARADRHAADVYALAGRPALGRPQRPRATASAHHARARHDPRPVGARRSPSWSRSAATAPPKVQDLPISELAVARGVHTTAARNHLADSLDLAFRLPGNWAELRAGRGEVWVVRRIASMSRHLDREQVRIVDTAVLPLHRRVPRPAAVDRRGRDPARRPRARPPGGRERARRRYVAPGPVRRARTAQGLRPHRRRRRRWLDAVLERVADALEARPDLLDTLDPSREELRADGARAGSPIPTTSSPCSPAPTVATTDDARAQPTREPAPAASRARALRPPRPGRRSRAHEPVARVEQLGPQLLDEVTRLLGHSHVTLKPVIDLNPGGRSTATSTHPTSRNAGSSAPPVTSFPTPSPRPDASTPTTPTPMTSTGPRARPATTTTPRSAADITAPRPTSTTRSTRSHPASTSGARHTDSGDSSTVRAPTGCRPPSGWRSRPSRGARRPSGPGRRRSRPRTRRRTRPRRPRRSARWSPARSRRRPGARSRPRACP